MKILNFVDEQNFVSSDTNKQKIQPNEKNQANWTRVEDFDICIFVIFYRYCQKPFSGDETGD